MTSKPLAGLLAVLAASAAGCLSDGSAPQGAPGQADAETPPSVAEMLARAAAEAAALGCEPDFDRDETSSNLVEIANVTWPEFEMFDTNVSTSHGEAELIHGTDLLLVARYGEGGFEVVNVSDPYHPAYVALYNLTADAEGMSLDIKVTTDGKTVVSGRQGAIDIIDISDPLQPVFEKTVPFPQAVAATFGQAHMLETYNVDGAEYVFAASQFNHGVLVFRVTGEPGSRDLEFLTLFAPLIGGPLAAHDMTALWDPVAKKHLLWVANGFGGFVVADIADPSLPLLISAGPPIEPYVGWTHTISVAIYGDKRYAATMAEIGAMALKVYDVTVLSAPVLLGTWTVEDLPTSTQHNTQIAGDFLYLAHYDYGFFRFNLREFVENVGPLPAYNLGPIAGVAGGGLQAHGHFQNPDRTMMWETVIVNGVHFAVTAGAPLYVVLDGCLPAGNQTMDAYY